jgi:hypothetical protein
MHPRIIRNTLDINKQKKTEVKLLSFVLPPQHFRRFDLESLGQRKSCSGFNPLEYCFIFLC